MTTKTDNQTAEHCWQYHLQPCDKCQTATAAPEAPICPGEALPFIPKFAGMHGDNPNAIQIIECGCCNQYHRVAYYGDCRNDNERFADPEDFEARWYGGGYPSVEVYED